MTSRNWSKHRERERMRDRGTVGGREDLNFMVPLLPPTRAPNQPLSKIELREQLAAAMAATAKLQPVADETADDAPRPTDTR